ncbi:MAG: PTS sugar transporter subunit IIA [Desulfobacterales bacterium]|jgi:PTS system mannose-specific IIA component|nr:PTS sugar transporter subunit IIA [Desulfobacterales bacterium]MCU0585330.1 PTS sugar transporter subunit IIA [Desulfobacterales bacterium]
MIGIVVVTHSRLGEALIDATEFIVGSRPEGVVAVSIDINQNVDKLRERVAAGIKKAGRDDGVLILTDMFGGTPSNISFSFLEAGRIEVLSGVNLPILVQAVTSRGRMGLSELAASLETFGRKSITLASGILKGNKRDAP